MEEDKTQLVSGRYETGDEVQFGLHTIRRRDPITSAFCVCVAI